MKVKVKKMLRDYAFSYKVQKTLKVDSVIEIPKGKVLDGLVRGNWVGETKDLLTHDGKGELLKKKED